MGRTYQAADVAQKVTGGLVYGSDMCRPDMLHARLLLSPIAHGRVVSLDASRAKAVPGVVAVFSGDDARGLRFSRQRLFPGQENCLDDEPLFAARVRHVGDRVAAVVATTREAAEIGVESIDVEYEELPAALTPAEALQDGATEIHPAGNLLFEYELALGADVEGGGEGNVVTTTCTSTQRIHHGALDLHFCIADFDASGRLTLWSPGQSVHSVRAIVAGLLDLPVNRVRVVKVPVGGSFGGRTEFMVEPVAGFLAHALKRPVRLALDREQCMVATMTRPATTTEVTTSVTPDGHVESFHADTTVDAGAYASSAPDYAIVMTHKTPRLYRLPHIRHRSRAVYTNGPVSGGTRGWGAPEICAAVEIHLDLAARRLAIDPVELRLRNLVHPFDVDPVTGMSLGDARVAECLRQGAAAFDWPARRRELPAGTRYRRGVGVACGAHKNGLQSDSFTESVTMALMMNEDGTLVLNASLHELGCGVATMMRVIVGEVLGVDPEQVAASEADTDATPFDVGCLGSRMTYVGGAAARATAEELRTRLIQVAAKVLGVEADRLFARDGGVCVRGADDRCVPFSRIVREGRARFGDDVIVTTTYKGTSNPGSYSVQFAEVEVDTATGLTRVTDFLAVGDVGMAINRGMVEGQFQGAVQMGIGYALCEDLPLDPAGRVPPGGFKAYHMVNMPDMPDVRVLLIEHPGDDGPFGAKSVGEIATVPTAPAVINAVNHALGTCISALPATPERIIAAVHGDDADSASGAACSTGCL